MDQRHDHGKLHRGVVLDLDRQKGLGHAKMKNGLVVCIEVSKFHKAVLTGNSNQPLDIGERDARNCPTIRNRERILLYLPDRNPPGRKHPRVAAWTIVRGAKKWKPPYKNDKGVRRKMSRKRQPTLAYR